MSKQLLQESETVELKKSLAELKQELVSMAAILNKHPAGTLWFGVRNDGTVTGLDANDKTLTGKPHSNLLATSIHQHVESLG